jgi:uncharacterized protein YjbJ (UPF0337 family)
VSKFLEKEGSMNKDELKGKLENLKGRAKEALGSLSGDKETQAEGTVERVKGAAQEKVGEVKEDISRKTDRPYDEDDED